DRLCILRWETGEWSSCSATCGVGLMTRTVACTHRPSRDSNHTEAVRDKDCQNPKPSPPCAKDECQPQWVTTSWSQCSVTCGNGVQRLQAVCRKQKEDGAHWTVDPGNCSTMARPTKIRPCSLRPCESKRTSVWWRMDPWSPCSASCGGGSQTRSVRCMKGPEGRSREVESQHCLSTGRRPSLTRTCNVQPCARWCRDSTRYCEKVRQLELCPLPQFKNRCCHSCSNT
uniref:PLAC domain-containing protein n=1 Tax=Labrus bergylta TaxID=56723 RepID=A0A3Q3MYH6_9LABR